MDLFLDTSAPDGTPGWKCYDGQPGTVANPVPYELSSTLDARFTQQKGGVGTALSVLKVTLDDSAQEYVLAATLPLTSDVDFDFAAAKGLLSAANAAFLLFRLWYDGRYAAWALMSYMPNSKSDEEKVRFSVAKHTLFGRLGQSAFGQTREYYWDDLGDVDLYSDMASFVCNRVIYPRGDGTLPSRYDSATYSATVAYRVFNSLGNRMISTAPYRAIVRVYANNGHFTNDSGWLPATGDELETTAEFSHTFNDLALNRGDQFTVRLMHVMRQSESYFPDLSVQFSTITTAVQPASRSSLHGTG